MKQLLLTTLKAGLLFRKCIINVIDNAIVCYA